MRSLERIGGNDNVGRVWSEVRAGATYILQFIRI